MHQCRQLSEQIRGNQAVIDLAIPKRAFERLVVEILQDSTGHGDHDIDQHVMLAFQQEAEGTLVRLFEGWFVPSKQCSKNNA